MKAKAAQTFEAKSSETKIKKGDATMQKRLKLWFSSLVAVLTVVCVSPFICNNAEAVATASAQASPAEGGIASASFILPGSTSTTLTATPNPGYNFVEWTWGTVGVNDNYTHSDKSSPTCYIWNLTQGSLDATAHFEKATYAVTVEKDPQEGGSAFADTNNPTWGETVTLTAQATDGYTFDHWEVTQGGAQLNDASSESTTFTMPMEPVTVKAVFEKENYSVTVAKEPENGGTASADPSTAMMGTIINLNAEPLTGFIFKHWEVTEGDAQLEDSTDPSTSFFMPTHNVGVKAIFEQATYNVEVTSEPANAGTASADPSSAMMGGTINLTAEPYFGYEFKEWQVTEGNAQLEDSTDPSTSFIMPTENVKIKAIFEEEVIPSEDEDEDEPVDPSEAEDEDEPVDPSEAEDEDEPVDPSEAEDEDEPVDPSEAEDEDEPVDPSEAEDEDEPVDPSEAEDEDEPVDPSEAEDEDEPVDPSEAEDEDEPVDPSDKSDGKANDSASSEKSDCKDETNAPKTGDESNIMLWASIAMVSLSGLVFGTSFINKKKSCKR